MKNIHILPTDKPSSIGYDGVKNLHFVNDFIDDYQNIYITSDEEIKEGDWCYHPLLKGGCIILSKFDNPNSTMKKIILTTDADLIKDGVQAIDNEFLEWFVKNPSCEEVKVVDDKKPSSKNIFDAVEGDLVYSHHGHGGIINSLSMDTRVGIDNYIETAITSETGWETLDINNYRIYDKCYKIIIPKEEPMIKCELCKRYPRLEGTNKCESCYSVVRHVLEQDPRFKDTLLPDLRKKQETPSVGAENQIFKIVLDEKWIPNKVSIIEAGNNSVLDKQETLEEAAEIFIKKQNFNSLEIDDKIFEAILFGAKWQQERSYSEEDMLEFGEWMKVLPLTISGFVVKTKTKSIVVEKTKDLLQIWFEQFKKK